jgi:hypothetical protein
VWAPAATARSVAQVVARLGAPPPGTLTDRPDGTCRWLAPPDTLDWHALRLASIGLAFDVNSPADLVAHLRTTAALFQAATAVPARQSRRSDQRRARGAGSEDVD